MMTQTKRVQDRNLYLQSTVSVSGFSLVFYRKIALRWLGYANFHKFGILDIRKIPLYNVHSVYFHLVMDSLLFTQYASHAVVFLFRFIYCS